jgi:adenylate cyclase
MSQVRRGSLLERAYGRLGTRYPQVAVVAQLQLVYPVLAVFIALLALYLDMSGGEFVVLVIVGAAGFFLYHLAYAAEARRVLAPVQRWLVGERDQAATVDAWTVCASFPREMFKREWTGYLGALGYSGLLLWAMFATWQLALPAYTVIPLYLGTSVFVLYVQSLRFLALEQVLRPVLEHIARQATDEVDLYAAGPRLRTRLLAVLPAINVITGVFVAGVFQTGNDLGDFALAGLISVGVASTISLALTLLLVDSVTAPIAALQEATGRVGRGDFAARVPVVTTDETGALARSFNQMAAGLEQRERLRDAFGAFVDPDLTERVLEEGTDLAGEEVEVSMLFMDIRGFTTYSEQAEAHVVVARLNDLYGEVVPVILRHDGHANKFIGDGLLAVFGAPNRLADHADRAVAAGLEIARLVRDRYGGELRVGIGVNTGRVVVGTIGGGGRLDFTVIGDAVNTAARVESATRQTDDDLLITEATRRALSNDHGGWEERPPVALKGKAQEVRLYGSGALNEAASASPDVTAR